METRQHSLAEINKQMEDQKVLVAEMKRDMDEKLAGFGEKFSGFEDKFEKILKCLAGGRSPPQVHEASSSPTSGILATPSQHHPPDPPDRLLSDVRLKEKFDPKSGRDSLLPNGMSTRLTKIGFPMFDGTSIQEWISRCEDFFMLDSTPPELKTRLASLHLEGKARQWHHNYIRQHYNIYPSWPEYVGLLSRRFSKLFDDPLSMLMSLKQGNETIEEYLDKFDCALTRCDITEAHALSVFLTNIQQHLALHVRQFGVTTVAEAAQIAKLHESALACTPLKSYRAPFSPYIKEKTMEPTFQPPSAINMVNSNSNQNVEATKTPYSISYSEMQDRKSKGLCMHCNEPYTPGHHLKHKKARIQLLEGYEVGSDVVNEVQIESSGEQEKEVSAEVHAISSNALTGDSNYHCMWVTGVFGENRRLHVLIDPGSTHNFINQNLANEIGCKLQPIKPMSVIAAGGNLVTHYKCTDFQLKIQGYTLDFEVRTLNWDSCDVVLGVQWLCTLGEIMWNFDKLRMTFSLNGEKYVLRGVNKSSYKVFKGKGLNKVTAQGSQLAMLQICEVETEATGPDVVGYDAQLIHMSVVDVEEEKTKAVQPLIQKFSNLFEEPSSWTSFHERIDHKIQLVTNKLTQGLVSSLEDNIKERIIDIYTQKGEEAVVPANSEQNISILDKAVKDMENADDP